MATLSTLKYMFDSRYATSYANILNNNTVRFRSNLNESLVLKPNQKAKVLLRSIDIPIRFYQVDDRNDNTSFVLWNADLITQRNVNITPGSYTEDELAIEITRSLGVLMTEPGTITCTHNHITGKFTFTTDTDDYYLGFNNGTTELLGYPEIVNPPLVYGLTFAAPSVGTRPGHVTPITKIELHSNLPTSSNKSNRNKGISTVLETFPFGDLGTVQSYSSMNSHFKNDLLSETVTNIEVWLTDDKGEYLELKGLHWKVELVVEIYEPFK
jgi:hypothetical protein